MITPTQTLAEPTAPVLITGMSGAGLSSAARVLEDLGWYVAQNLPSELIIPFYEVCTKPGSPVSKVGVVTDVRGRDFTGNLHEVVSTFKERGINPVVLFLDARDDVLIRRFDSVRRTHPLQGSSTLQTGIERERELMSPIKEAADVVIETSDLSIHDLRRAIERTFSSLAQKRQHVTVQSFGFKHGAPADADIVVDMRFLPNPFWIPELRPFRGTDGPVSDYVLAQPGAQAFLSGFVSMFHSMLPGYQQEGKSFVTIAVGCTGGHHRSVAIAEELAKRLASEPELDVSVTHRDIARG